MSVFMRGFYWLLSVILLRDNNNNFIYGELFKNELQSAEKQIKNLKHLNNVIPQQNKTKIKRRPDDKSESLEEI